MALYTLARAPQRCMFRSMPARIYRSPADVQIHSVEIWRLSPCWNVEPVYSSGSNEQYLADVHYLKRPAAFQRAHCSINLVVSLPMRGNSINRYPAVHECRHKVQHNLLKPLYSSRKLWIAILNHWYKMDAFWVFWRRPWMSHETNFSPPLSGNKHREHHRLAAGVSYITASVICSPIDIICHCLWKLSLRIDSYIQLSPGWEPISVICLMWRTSV